MTFSGEFRAASAPRAQAGLSRPRALAPRRDATAKIVSRAELARNPTWLAAFKTQRKDHRYYEIVEDSLQPEFLYRYFVIDDGNGNTLAVQPFFVVTQDLVVAAGRAASALVGLIRRIWPRFMFMRTLMVGCVAGEGHLDASDEATRESCAQHLLRAAMEHARRERIGLVVLKEFPAAYRRTLNIFREKGFTRLPSFPMTILNIQYASFDAYMAQALSHATRKNLRRKFKAAARSAPIELSVLNDVSSIASELYPLYLQVFSRARLRFEQLTETFISELGRRMPDKARFFVWRQDGRIIAFSLCMVNGDTICDEYIGLDYEVAHGLHLYHLTFRDIVSWAIANGYKWYLSNALNYDPKLHLKQRLYPLDIYVRHTSGPLNALLKLVLPLMGPTRQDKTIVRFPNKGELWGDEEAIGRAMPHSVPRPSRVTSAVDATPSV